MNDAVKPAGEDETLAQEFARLVAEYHGASEDDPTKPEAWNLLADFAVENGPAISATLAAQGQEAVDSDIIAAAKDICLVMDIDVSGRDISWRQSLESAVQHLRFALTAPTQPVGLPEGWRLVPEKPTIEMVKKAHKDHEGEPWLPYSLWESMLSAAPQPPAEGGWLPIESAPKAPWDVPVLVCRLGKANPWYGDQHISGYADVPGSAYWNDAGDCWTWIDAPHDACVPTHWMPLPPAPANGGEQ